MTTHVRVKKPWACLLIKYPYSNHKQPISKAPSNTYAHIKIQLLSGHIPIPPALRTRTTLSLIPAQTGISPLAQNPWNYMYENI